jgi:hypothetical protein
VPERADRGIREVRDEQAEERDRPDQRGRDRHEHRDEHEHERRHASMVDAEARRRRLAEDEHVEPMTHAPRHRRTRSDRDRRDQHEPLVDRGEARERGVLHDREVGRVEHALQQRGHTAEEHAEHDAHEDQDVDASRGAREHEPEQRERAAHHEHDLDEPQQLRIGRRQRHGAEGEHHDGLDREIQRVEPHDAGTQDAVGRDRLEQHGRDADRGGHDQHRRDLAKPERHRELPRPLDAREDEDRDGREREQGKQYQPQPRVDAQTPGTGGLGSVAHAGGVTNLSGHAIASSAATTGTALPRQHRPRRRAESRRGI